MRKKAFDTALHSWEAGRSADYSTAGCWTGAIETASRWPMHSAHSVWIRRIGEAAYPAGRIGRYLEVHIEQGPVLESLDMPIGVVEGIAGQSRLSVSLTGRAGHAGTLPMAGRRDALAAAAEIVLEIERLGLESPGLLSTVGNLNVSPGAANVVPGRARLCIDVRHANDEARMAAVAAIRARGFLVGTRRGIGLQFEEEEHHHAVPADARLLSVLGKAVKACEGRVCRITSGTGHDAAVMAAVAPMAMLFIRSPGAESHNPQERVLDSDVRLALDVVIRYLELLARGDSAGMENPMPPGEAETL